MSSDQLEFSDMKDLQKLVNRKQGNQQVSLPARQTGLRSQVGESQYSSQFGGQTGLPLEFYGGIGGGKKPVKQVKQVKQRGGQTGFPLDYYTGIGGGKKQTGGQTGFPLDYYTGVGGNPKVSNQKGGRFGSLWGTNQPTFNQVSPSNFNTIYNQLGSGGDGDGDLSSRDGQYSRSDVVGAVSKVTGDEQPTVDQTITTVYGPHKKQFSESELKEIADIHTEANRQLHEQNADVDQLSQGLQNLSLSAKRKSRSAQKAQSGGNATGMPLQWYQPTTSMRGGDPHQGQHQEDDLNFFDDMVARKCHFAELSGGDQVITNQNMTRLFNYLYHVYPDLKNQESTSNIFQQAEDDDAYIWCDIQDLKLIDAIDYIIGQTINFYENTYPSNPQGLSQLKSIFGQ
jgi:hypothetical protein